jgi:hypothetical protein
LLSASRASTPRPATHPNCQVGVDVDENRLLAGGAKGLKSVDVMLEFWTKRVHANPPVP